MLKGVAVLVRLPMAGATLLGPCQEIAEPVDDAAAMTPVGWTELPAAIVVERAPADAQEPGSFVDGEKWVVGVVGHGVLPQFDTRSVLHFSHAHKYGIGTPLKSTRLSQEVSIAAGDEPGGAVVMPLHPLPQSGIPILGDLPGAIDESCDLAMAGASAPAVERDERIAQVLCTGAPGWNGRGPGMGRRENAAQGVELVAGTADRCDARHQNGDGDGMRRNIGARHRELDGGAVSAQHDVLAAIGVGQDVLDVRDGRHEHAFLPSVRSIGGLVCNGRERGGPALREPYVARQQGGEGGVGERCRAPTLRQDARVPADA